MAGRKSAGAASKKAPAKKNEPLTEEEKRAKKKDYYKKWYAENKDALKAKKAEKYRKNKDYRQGIIDRNKDARKEKREQRVSGMKAPVRGPVADKRYVKRVAAVNGKDEVVFTKHYMADCMGLSPVTIYEWRRKKIFPPASHLDESKRQWYTQVFVDFMIQCYDDFAFSRTKASLDKFREKVLVAWNKRTKDGSRRL